MDTIPCFKAYDLRGKVPGELNVDLAYKIGKAYKKLLDCKSIVIGHDVRSSSDSISEALAKGLTDCGVNVIDIGLCGTEMIYFATPFFDADGGIMITASHNPPEYNGMKFVRRDSVPVSSDSGLKDIERSILDDKLAPLADIKGTVTKKDVYADFIKHLQTFFKKENIKPLKVIVNGGNGCAGIVLDKIESLLPIKMIKVFNDPDPNFPNGVPNPLLIENRKWTIDALLENKADLGVAWDGDYDRCFFFDEEANFIEGYYIVALLAKSILKSFPGEKIIHDPRLTWNTIYEVEKSGGIAVQSKSGHTFIKEKMRSENAVYGGEMSAHHYFRENHYSDSGMIPFFLVLQLISESGKPLSQLVKEMISHFPCSGEINTVIPEPAKKIKEIEETYSAGKKDYTDGLSVEFDTWRFNIRMSNTEPILRLNVESRGNIKLMEEKTEELLKIIRG
jgi:phosphomannomutase